MNPVWGQIALRLGVKPFQARAGSKATAKSCGELELSQMAKQPNDVLNPKVRGPALRATLNMTHKARCDVSREVTFHVVDKLASCLDTCQIARTGSRSHLLRTWMKIVPARFRNSFSSLKPFLVFRLGWLAWEHERSSGKTDLSTPHNLHP